MPIKICTNGIENMKFCSRWMNREKNEGWWGEKEEYHAQTQSSANFSNLFNLLKTIVSMFVRVCVCVCTRTSTDNARDDKVSIVFQLFFCDFPIYFDQKFVGCCKSLDVESCYRSHSVTFLLISVSTLLSHSFSPFLPSNISSSIIRLVFCPA